MQDCRAQISNSAVKFSNPSVWSMYHGSQGVIIMTSLTFPEEAPSSWNHLSCYIYPELLLWNCVQTLMIPSGWTLSFWLFSDYVKFSLILRNISTFIWWIDTYNHGPHMVNPYMFSNFLHHHGIDICTFEWMHTVIFEAVWTSIIPRGWSPLTLVSPIILQGQIQAVLNSGLWPHTWKTNAISVRVSAYYQMFACLTGLAI